MKRFLLAYFGCCFFFLTLFSSGFVDSQDGLQYLTIARRIYYDHTFEMPAANFDAEQNIHMSVTKGKDGKIYSITGLGYSLSLLPAVWTEDVFLHAAQLKPIAAFPLQNDWPVLLFASMTNAFWGALLIVMLYLYLLEFKFTRRQAVAFSFLAVTASNLMPYTKHVFAHLMFVSFLVATFYLVKKYARTRRRWLMFGSGVTFGCMMIAYNESFTFAGPALAIYYLLLTKPTLSRKSFQRFGADLVVGLMGLLPWATLYWWFNHVRVGSTGTGVIVAATSAKLTHLPAAQVIFEGIWGLLFSPGKSVFLFTPLLLILVLFWFKLSKKLRPEIIVFSVISLTYVWLIGTSLGAVDYPVWHGDSSWGPRYLTPILPLLFILIAHIYVRLTRIQKWLVFYPLVIVGWWINLVGLSLPYQIRFQGLQTDVKISGRNFNVYEYGNEIPRYSPVLRQSKTFVKRLLTWKTSHDHGNYQLKLRDGFDYPFNPTGTDWRKIYSYAVIEFDNPVDQPAKTITLDIRNQQLNPTSSAAAQLRLSVNDHPSVSTTASLLVNEAKMISMPLDQSSLLPQGNRVVIEHDFDGLPAEKMVKQQELFLQALEINGISQNISTLDYPYVSPISQQLFGAEYAYWGKIQTDPWPIWHMHSGIYEKTFDFWWLRPLYYWDFPRSFFGGLLIFNLIELGVCGYLVWREIKYTD